jgi:hypothetical protein
MAASPLDGRVGLCPPVNATFTYNVALAGGKKLTCFERNPWLANLIVH